MTLDELGIDPLPILRLKLMERAAVALGILALVGAGYWYFWFGERQTTISGLESKISQQKQDIQSKQRILAKLPDMRKRYAELQVAEQKAMEVLPSSKEIPALLTDISLAGHEEGLEFILFKPEKEIPSGFYAEVPVALEVMGTYHAVAQFMDKVAKMSRLVTIKDIEMAPQAAQRPGRGAAPAPTQTTTDKLTTKARATTYRFLDPDEQAAFQEAEKAKQAKTRGRGAAKKGKK